MRDGELHALLSRLDCNIFGCFTRDGGPLCGHACYLTAAMFNHSCEPNCTATAGVKEMVIVTNQAIGSGSELTIAYTDVDKPLEARRKLLSTCYRFRCACGRCKREERGKERGVRPKQSYEGSQRHGGGRGSSRRGAQTSAPPAKQAADEADTGAPPNREKGRADAEPWFAALA
mmetsp:Transcript_6074/g.14076  ORF Transcript_6074/g.14076 Transcript_6074/m.14076 type:complete len:174 (-) Transcript_6074:164-685(-)